MAPWTCLAFLRTFSNLTMGFIMWCTDFSPNTRMSSISLASIECVFGHLAWSQNWHWKAGILSDSPMLKYLDLTMDVIHACMPVEEAFLFFLFAAISFQLITLDSFKSLATCRMYSAAADTDAFPFRCETSFGKPTLFNDFIMKVSGEDDHVFKLTLNDFEVTRWNQKGGMYSRSPGCRVTCPKGWTVRPGALPGSTMLSPCSR